MSGPSRKKIRILLADREGVFRLGLKKLFGLEDDLRVVAEAADSEQALALAQQFQPNVVFIQAELASFDSGEGSALATIKSRLTDCKIVVTASALGEEESLNYIKTGAFGVILKTVDPALFVKCARKVMENELWMPKKQVAQMAKLLEAEPVRPNRPRDTLTSRERIVISHLLQGCRNREIAQHLSIAEQTVKNHLRTVFDKLGVSDRLELVLYAIQQRLELPVVQPEPPAPASRIADPTKSSGVQDANLDLRGRTGSKS
jgi:DNA-binding NarL/FixJ family response regulator